MQHLCQSSQHCHRTYRLPEPPCMPGISPTPSQPCIIHTTQNQVLSPSTSRTSCTSNELNALVAAILLKLSRTFSLNVTPENYLLLCPSYDHEQWPILNQSKGRLPKFTKLLSSTKLLGLLANYMEATERFDTAQS